LLEPVEIPAGAPATARTTITLVFTDVVGSSAAKRAAALGPDASARDRAYLEGIQAKHLRLVRSAVAEHNGKEIMTIGDSFFLTFEDPADALRCAAAIHHRLRGQPIDTSGGPMQLRIGIHIGAPEYFENSWHGTDVDTASRTQSAGSPGQIVVTEAVRDAVGDPLDIKLRLLGTFALKGIGNVKLWDADYDRHGLRRPTVLSREQQRRRRVFKNAAMILIALALAGGVGWRWRQDRQAAILASAAKQSIMVADFENKTGEPVFDHTLTDAFSAQLEQSPVLRLVSQEHLRQSMTYLRKSPQDPLTPAVVREIGIREGVKAYLAGTIAKLGGGYVVTVGAEDISTGDEILSEEAEASDKDHVLTALDKVASAMRHKLGESLASIRKLDTPLGQATTPSLEAFRAYALGDVAHETGHDIPQAEGYYRRAVQIDPNFAMAWARLGVIFLSTGEHDKSLEYLTKAYQLSKNVSEHERLYIEAHYYQYGLGDLPKAIATLKLATQTYPRNMENYINLGNAQEAYGQLEQISSPFTEAVTLDPKAAVAQDNLLGAELAMDKVADAQATLANMKQSGIDPGRTFRLREVLMLDFLRGDGAGMLQTVDATRGRIDDFTMTASLALTQEFSGHYRAALASWQRAQRQVAVLGARDAQAAFLLSSVSGRAMAGNCDHAATQVQAALKLDKNQETLQQAAFAASLCNAGKIALPILADLAKAYPSNTLVNQVTIPQSRAALALDAHQPGKALEQLEGSERFDLVSPAAYLRGLAYLELHDGQNAVAAFRAATRYRGAALLGSQNFPQAQLGLARAYAMAGDKTMAKTAYENFFTTWKTADPALPQLTSARMEFATLQ
jgi:class 3 adenylate cyclase/tetratricopeptide (TPR) repeat protein